MRLYAEFGLIGWLFSRFRDESHEFEDLRVNENDFFWDQTIDDDKLFFRSGFCRSTHNHEDQSFGEEHMKN